MEIMKIREIRRLQSMEIMKMREIRRKNLQVNSEKTTE